MSKERARNREYPKNKKEKEGFLKEKPWRRICFLGYVSEDNQPRSFATSPTKKSTFCFVGLITENNHWLGFFYGSFVPLLANVQPAKENIYQLLGECVGGQWPTTFNASAKGKWNFVFTYVNFHFWNESTSVIRSRAQVVRLNSCHKSVTDGKFFPFSRCPNTLVNKRYYVQNQVFYIFFGRLIDSHFKNVSIQVTWCYTSHECAVVKRVM